jgi:cytochrome c2
MFFGSCRDKSNADAQTHTVNNSKLKNNEIHIELDQLLKQRKSKTVHVLYDENFNCSKQYLGYDLLPVIDSIIKSGSFDTTNAIISFECHDGYKPTITLAKLFNSARPYIVYKDLAEKGDQNWPDSVQRKFDPYYLVWDSVKREDHSFVWPYGLVSITLSWMEVQNKLIYPANNLSLVKGFHLFQQICMKCHSLNGVGGSMAPEFNFPKNITEYWKEEDIIAFAKNPTSYRKSSVMPPVTNLQDSDFKK